MIVESVKLRAKASAAARNIHIAQEKFREKVKLLVNVLRAHHATINPARIGSCDVTYWLACGSCEYVASCTAN